MSGCNGRENWKLWQIEHEHGCWRICRGTGSTRPVLFLTHYDVHHRSDCRRRYGGQHSGASEIMNPDEMVPAANHQTKLFDDVERSGCDDGPGNFPFRVDADRNEGLNR